MRIFAPCRHLQIRPRGLSGALVLIVVAALLSFTGAAIGAVVNVEVSSQTVYVGSPFTVRINIEYEDDYREPALPEIPGLSVVSGPNSNRSSSTRIIGRRMTRSNTYTLTYELMAEAVGNYMIPSITAVADGEEFRTEAVNIIAVKSDATDLLFTNVTAEREEYYLGETFEATLEIWVKPYYDERYDRGLEVEDMWRTLSGRSTNLGVFGEGDINITYRRAQHTDSDGVEREYYVYMLKGRVTPRQIGSLRFDDVRIRVDYPEEMGEVRDSFFITRSTIGVTRTRPLVAGVGASEIEILATPEEGRPAVFAGAVGLYGFEISGQPTEVATGDPITLTMKVRDFTPGGGRLDALQPTPLDRVEALMNDFRVPTDPLAGVVEGTTKTFTQTIRARHEDVEWIPSIPFAFFDPRRGAYITLHSDRIPISVSAAAILPMNEVIGSGGGSTSPTASELTDVAGGIVASYGIGDELLAEQRQSVSWAMVIAVLIAGPGIYVLAFVGQWRVRKLRNDTGYARRRRAQGVALKRIKAGGAGDKAKQAEAVGGAVREYIADRCNLGAGAVTTAEIVVRLSENNVDSDLIEEVRQLLADCEAMTYAGGDTEGDTGELRRRARRSVNRLRREAIK